MLIDFFRSMLRNTYRRCADLFTSVIVLYFVTCTCGNSKSLSYTFEPYSELPYSHLGGLTLHTLMRVSECSKKVGWMIALGYISMHSITFVFTGIAIKQVRGKDSSFNTSALLNTCLEQMAYHLWARMGLWPVRYRKRLSPSLEHSSRQWEFFSLRLPTKTEFCFGCLLQAALDCYTFALIIMNALSRPRSTSQRLLNMLLKDGLVYFLVRWTILRLHHAIYSDQ